MIPLPIANGLYQSRSLPISNQCCINWYPAIIDTQGLSQQVLFGTPGLSLLAETGGTSRINRGSHTKEGVPYFVQGDRLFDLIKTTSLGSDVFTENELGILSGTDRASMADNGTQLMIVADDKGWIYNESANWSTSSGITAENWRDIAFGNDTFVAISFSDSALTSSDGITWTERACVDENWSSVIYGNSVFVAVSTNNEAMTSPDGITWTARTMPAGLAGYNWQGIAYGEGLFVAVNDTFGQWIATSPDGITWTQRDELPSQNWVSIAYGDGLFVAVSDEGSNRVATSTDGITWTQRTPSSDATWEKVTYGDGLFVAVSIDEPGEIMTSTNGINWTSQENPSQASLYSVAYGNNIFTAIGRVGLIGSVTIPANCVTINSGDGETWYKPKDLPISQVDYSVLCFGAGVFTTVGAAAVGMNSNIGGASFAEIGAVDSDFLANGNPRKVIFVDGYFMVSTDEKKVIRSDANDGLSWNALNFSEAEADPDSIQALEIDNNDPYIVGTETIEVFDAIGGNGFGFQRSGIIYNKGATSPDAVIKTTQGIAFLGAGKDESPSMWSIEGGSLLKISHPGIDNEINSYSLEDLESCFALYYSEAGEFFASFTFPKKTFVYGFASKLWHERESSGARWRVNSLTTAYGMLLAGDSIDGRIGEMSLDVYDEYGEFFNAQVSGPNFSNQGERAFYPKIEATMEAGVGNADTPDPVLVYDYSDDGKIFTGARARTIGKKGEYNKRAIWRRNGSAPRYRTNRFRFTGKTKRTFIKLEADIEA